VNPDELLGRERYGNLEVLCSLIAGNSGVGGRGLRSQRLPFGRGRSTRELAATDSPGFVVPPDRGAVPCASRGGLRNGVRLSPGSPCSC